MSWTRLCRLHIFSNAIDSFAIISNESKDELQPKDEYEKRIKDKRRNFTIATGNFESFWAKEKQFISAKKNQMAYHTEDKVP